MRLQDIIETTQEQIFISQVDEINYNYVRIQTIFQYSDYSYIDVYYHYDTGFLTDLGVTLELCHAAGASLSEMEKFLKSTDIIDLCHFYQISIKGFELIKHIHLSLNEEIFKFGEFCSIVSAMLMKEKLHVR